MRTPKSVRIKLLLYWLGFLPTLCEAQLCNGFPGVVKFAQSFGAGNNPGPALPPGSTNYVYGIPDFYGHYALSNTSGLNGISWHDAPDHTPLDINGYMMVFDANDAHDVFYQVDIPIVCNQTDYEFSVWIANINQPFECSGTGGFIPNVRVVLSDPATGTVLAETLSGLLPVSATMTWHKFGVTFFVPAGMPILRLAFLNNAQGGCGNDIAIDDIEMRICNPVFQQTDTICAGNSVIVGDSVYTHTGLYVNVFDLPATCSDSVVITNVFISGAPIEQNLVICPGDSAQVGVHFYKETGVYFDTIAHTPCNLIYKTNLTVQSDTALHHTFNLCKGDRLRVGNSVYYEPGIYYDTLISTVGCDSLVESELLFSPFSVFVAPHSIELKLGETFTPLVTAGLSNNIRWVWTPNDNLSCDTCSNPVLRPVANGFVRVTATDLATGCQASDSVFISVSSCIQLYIPNVFAPDSYDNKTFFVYSDDCILKINYLEIYDRWGSLVFKTGPTAPDQTDSGWDGRIGNKRARPGVYVYKTEFELVDGTTEQRYGTVSLVR